MSLGRILFGIRKAYDDRRRAAAKSLLAVAEAFATEHRLRVGIQNPPPSYLDSSRPGEYPRRRTGIGQAGVLVVPESEAAIARLLYVDVGYAEDVWYMQALVDAGGRRGLADTLADVRPRLEAMAGDVTATAKGG